MLWQKLLHPWTSRNLGGRKHGRAVQRKAKRRLVLERLEDRRVLDTYTVNDAGDRPDADLTDDICDADNLTDNQECTLRAAIQTANHHAGKDTINFAGPTTIAPNSPLPNITDPLIIDGYQGGSRTELVGTNAGPRTDGFTYIAGDSELRGMVINRFSDNGVVLRGGTTLVVGNYIGTDVAGEADAGNQDNGVDLRSNGNTVGGIGTLRNVLSGNDRNGVVINIGFSGNLIIGNYIGTNKDGDKPLGNSGIGVQIYGASNNTVGTSEAPNVVSANELDGVVIQLAGATGNVVYGNMIGTDKSGMQALGNGTAPNGEGDDDVGVRINDGASNNTVDNNTISANIDGGVRIDDGAFNNTVTANRIGVAEDGQTELGNLTYGLVIRGGATDTFVADNVISGNDTYGVWIAEGSTRNTVVHNWIGTNQDGTKDVGNTLDGVFIDDAPGNTIGGVGASKRNIISGNDGSGVVMFKPGATCNVVQGNYIGTDGTGTAYLGNNAKGVHIVDAPVNLLGGAGGGEGNVISGNGEEGVRIALAAAVANLVQENKIGTDVTGTADLGNTSHGVFIVDAPGNLVGGAGSGNVISGNDGQGVRISGPAAAGNLVLANKIGTDVSGSIPLGNLGEGVFVDNAPSNFIGVAGAGNVISSNFGRGVVLDGLLSTGNAIVANKIGTDVTGFLGLGNLGDGVHVRNAGTNLIGAENVISANRGHGINLEGAGAMNNMIFSNKVGTDGTGFLALGNLLDGVYLNGAPWNILGNNNVISANFGNGIQMSGAGATGNVVFANKVGTDVTGFLALGNLLDGVYLNGAPANTIGADNVISGNFRNGIQMIGAGATGNVVFGNKVGTDVTGFLALGNLLDGIHLTGAPGNILGANNVVSANFGHGIYLSTAGAAGNLIFGNKVGTDTTGFLALGNLLDGVHLNGAPANIIGADNVISGNFGNGVLLGGAGAAGNLIAGNKVGTDTTGFLALGNLKDGVHFLGAPNNTVGPDNVISANFAHGIQLATAGATGNVIFGNKVGTDVTGFLGLGNLLDGVHITGAPANTIGGNNVISANFGNGVQMVGAGATGNTVAGNNIGTDVTGTLALGNLLDGIHLNGAPANIVGADNAISANFGHGIQIIGAGAARNRVFSNKVGTDSTGFGALGNLLDGVHINGGPANDVGPDNVISANFGNGVLVFGAGATGNVIHGNKIGTSLDGSAGLGNRKDGVVINNAPNTTVGGLGAADGNVISANGRSGVTIGGNQAAGNVVQGNKIGTDAAGTKDLGNMEAGVSILDAPRNTIGGPQAAARNIISGNEWDGILIFGPGAIANVIQSNYIGTDVTGAIPLGNTRNGLQIDGGSNTIVGGPTLIQGNPPQPTPGTPPGNVIAANTRAGVFIQGATARGNDIKGNSIGTNAALAQNLGNLEHGVFISNASGNIIGGPATADGNAIAFNGATLRLRGHGVVVASGTGNTIRRNSIFMNSGRGIDLDNDSFTVNDPGDGDAGANDRQDYPVVTGVRFTAANKTITWTLDSTPGRAFVVEFFANTELDPSGFGEGRRFLAERILAGNATGRHVFSQTFPLTDRWISAMATDRTTNSTSEFSTIDTDGDALADAWETGGIDRDEDGTIDLVLGSNPNHKDMFIEVDTMQGLEPLPNALPSVVAAFAAAPNSLIRNPDGRNGITMHAFVDDSGVRGIPRHRYADDPWPGYDADKAAFFGTANERNSANSAQILAAKALVYRYCIFADTQGASSSSGRAELWGNDFMVTFGDPSWGSPAEEVYTGTFMHELGHTLNLRHGGMDNLNKKPNYHSVMNYLWQFPETYPGGGTPDEHAYRISWTPDYSQQAFPSLNERNLTEANGIRGHRGHVLPVRGPLGQHFVVERGPVDWNQAGGAVDVGVVQDINGDGALDILRGQEDWSKLLYYFLESPANNPGTHGASADEHAEVGPPALDQQKLRTRPKSAPRDEARTGGTWWHDLLFVPRNKDWLSPSLRNGVEQDADYRKLGRSDDTSEFQPKYGTQAHANMAALALTGRIERHNSKVLDGLFARWREANPLGLTDELL